MASRTGKLGQYNDINLVCSYIGSEACCGSEKRWTGKLVLQPSVWVVHSWQLTLFLQLLDDDSEVLDRLAMSSNVVILTSLILPSSSIFSWIRSNMPLSMMNEGDCGYVVEFYVNMDERTRCR